MSSQEKVRDNSLTSPTSLSTSPFEPATVVELLRWRARHQPTRTAYTFLADGEREEAELTYAELDGRARAVAASLQALGVEGGRALLLYPAGLDYITAFFGCLYAGVIAVPAYPPRPAKPQRNLPRLRAIVNDCRPALALSTGPILTSLAHRVEQDAELSAMRWVSTDDMAGALAEEWQEPVIGGETLAFLQYTSGSTAAPKGVMVSHGNLLHNQRMIKLAFRQTEQSVVVGWLPLYHDMGLIGNVLQPLYLGARCILMSPTSFLLQPYRWLKAISQYKATTSGGPNFAYDLCVRKVTAAQRETLDLSNWTTAFNGAEPIRPDTIERFADTFAPCNFSRAAFSPCYGLAEATLLVTSRADETQPLVHEVQAAGLEAGRAVSADAADAHTRALVNCGEPLLNQKLLIVNPADLTQCAQQTVGEIWLSGPSVTHGYWSRPEETAQTFQAYLADTGDGPFLRTGDLGFLKDGQLFVTGRLKDLLVIRGRNHYPQDIELTVERSHAALRPGCGAAFAVEVGGEERLVVVQELDPRVRADAGAIVETIREAVSEEHEVQAYAVVLLAQGGIPKTSSGKIQRHACRQKFLAGDLTVAHEWRAAAATLRAPDDAQPSRPLDSREAVEAWLVAEFAARLGVSAGEIDVNQSVARYGLDSLAAIELAHSIETALSVNLPMTSLLRSATIAQLAAQILALLETPTLTHRPILASVAEDALEQPLSHGQQALWFLHQLAPESAAYNIASAVRVRSELDVPIFRRAFQTLVERHAALRTTFDSVQGRPIQRVHERTEVCFVETDAASWSAAELEEQLTAEAHRPFDLAHGPLLRVNLYRRAAHEHVVLLTVHHIVADFWSLAVLVRELGIIYESYRTGEPTALTSPALAYTDYVRWHTNLLLTPEGERLRSYWQKQLAGELPVLNLPTEQTPPPVQTFDGAAHAFSLSAELTAQLKALSNDHETTLYTTLLAAFQLLLHRYTQQREVLVGSPTTGRSWAETAGLVGYFVNPIVLRADFAGDLTFTAFLEQVRQTALAAFEHQDYPFPLLVEQLQPDREPSRPPLFQAMFVLQKSHLLDEQGLSAFALGETGARLCLGQLELESVALPQRVAQFDLTLVMAEAGDRLAASLQYNTDLLDAATAARLARHYERLLQSIVAEPQQRVATLPLLPAAEREQQLVAWNDTARTYPAACIHELFAQQATRTPAAVAVIARDERITYAELNRRANQLAHHLQRLGVGPDTLVGLLPDRTLDLVIGVLGILKAGGAYVPLDPQYPRERLAFMLADAGINILLTQQHLLDALPGTTARLLCLDRDAAALAQEQTDNPHSTTTAPNLAYVIYTSGSTGRPKGVAITHHSAATFLHWAHDLFSQTELSGVLAATSVCFDLSVFELFAPLTMGGTVILAENALSLPELAAAGAVTLVNTVPSALTEVLRLGGLPASVRTVNLAGEPLPRALVEAAYQTGNVERVLNLYGPTEDTTYSTWTVVRQGGGRVLIGRPVANTQAYVLDAEMQPVPVGVAGELYLAGDGLARGYLNRPELTAERFIPNPFDTAGGGRLYRTGDLARYTATGELDYLGRGDQQVKVRGYRIELGEIEAALTKQAGVREAVVLARDEAGDKRLVAYVVSEQPALDVRALRTALKERLPEYMLPAAFVQLAELPLTPNGKVDRKALPVPDWAATVSDGASAAPRTAVEELVAGVWAKVLGVGAVGAQDNFFELGGHSLLATQVVARLQDAFKVALPLRALFEAPTVAGLAARVEVALLSEHGAPPPVLPVERDRPLPLSFAQQRLWFLDQLTPGLAAYNIPAAVRLAGALDVAALTAALSEVVRRHEALRTTFETVAGEPAQVVAAPGELPLTLVELDHLVEAEREQEVARLVGEEARRPFDLAEGPLLRVTLLRLSAEEHVLLLTMHHIISDGWSLGVLVKEVAALYAAYAQGQASPLPELSVQYADYAVWQREWLSGAVLESQLSYWLGQLAGVPVLELPTDRPRPAVQSYQGASHRVVFSEGLSRRLKELSQGEGVTLFMTLLAAFKVLLWRYTGQADIAVGTPIAGRTRVELEELIGFFVNTLVLRTQLDGAESFQALLRRVREVTLAAYAHQDVPFEAVVEALQPERSLTHTPLFQVMLAWQNTPPAELALPGLTLRQETADSAAAQFDLTLFMHEQDASLAATLVYNRDLFDEPTMSRLVGHFETLLESAAADPRQTLAHLPLLPAAERQQLLVAWNDTQRPYPPSQPIHELFERQVTHTPDAVALIATDTQLTYAQLNRRANRLAHYLQGRGVGPETRVGVALPRRTELLVALLAILKAGGTYVPLDPQYPRERLAFMLADADAALLVTTPELLPSLPESATRALCLDAIADEIAQEQADNPPSATAAQNLAYVIYTSGSTGRPKGVAITHHSAATFLHWAHEVFAPAELSGVLAATSVCFDLSVFELFAPLTCGGAVILAENALSLPELAAAGAVTLVNTVPSALTEVLRLGGLPQSVRTVNLAGEPLPRQLVEAAYATGTVERVLNLYGPSEDTTYSTWTVVPNDDGRVLIGRPVANTQAYVLDAERQPVPVGVAGELYLSGDGLARGYLNRPELTAERFVPDPFDTAGGGRLYRTGDLVRYTATGELDYLGRGDQQVKVRGYRIELGEVEAALTKQPQVREAVVTARDEGGDKRLVAYVVAEDGAAVSVNALRAALKEQLPEYMLPAVFVQLAELPLTPNGKVDRKALPAPDAAALVAAEAYVAPRTEVEELLSQLWAGVLGVERVGVHDNFFELGGHSLLATQLVARARQSFRVELPLRSLFESPTVAGLAVEIEQTLRAGAGQEMPGIAAIDRDGPLPLSFAQQRLWFWAQLGAESAAYNMPVAVTLSGALDVAALTAALNEVVGRHEVLRTTFTTVGEEPAQVISAELTLPLPVVDLRGMPAAERAGVLEQTAQAEARRPFDLARGPLLRVQLVQLEETEHVLLLTMHHIVSDGWSMGVLLDELTAVYGAFAAGRPSTLAALPIQYADFAVWQRRWMQGEVLARQLDYWKRQLAGAAPVLELPTDRPRLAVQNFAGAREAIALDSSLTEQLKALSRERGVTLFMTLLAALQTLLHRYTGVADILVGVPIANRNRAETEALIGFFVNTLVLRADVGDDPSFVELLARVRGVTLEAYAHQDLPFEKLVEELQPGRDLSHTPLFQVLFVLEQGAPERAQLEGLALAAREVDSETAKFDLVLNVRETEAGLAGAFKYRTALFDAATVARMAEHFTTLLQGLVADPTRRLSELPLLTAAERRQLAEWNDTRVEYPPQLTLHELIEAQAARTPDAVAVVFEESVLTYAELNARANQLAHHLRTLGVGPETLVGVLLERSVELVVALLGVLKAGAAYVPLDGDYPPERLAFMLADAAAPVLLTQATLAARLPAPAAQVVCLDEDWPAIARQPSENPARTAGPQNLAYVIYTSGSTGRPKGAMNTHAGICNRLLWMQDAYQLSAADRVLQKTPFSFDVSVWEFFWPLMTGARLVLARPRGQQDSAYLIELIRRERITTLHFVPPMLQVFLDTEGVGGCDSLRRVICSGQALGVELQERFFARMGGAELHNLYGPTEAAVDVTAWACRPGAQQRTVPIGRPIANTQVYVLDAQMRPVPVGVVGELYLGGIGVGRGYWQRADLTAERFLPDPCGAVPGARLYRTGDRARFLPDGNVEFLGRLDFQAKVRGFRIELGEIEAALEAHPAVKETVVVAVSAEQGGVDARLVAYVVPAQGQQPTTSALRDYLKERLPEYMVPSVFALLAELPLTPNGKVDRKALPATAAERPALAAAYVAPRTALEQLLCAMWQEALGHERVGVHDNFFELGGDSIRAAVFVNRLQERLGELLHVVVMFDAPTVAGLAAYLEQRYAAAVARLCGVEVAGGEAAAHAPVVDAARLAEFRQLIKPLAPRTDGRAYTKAAPAIFVLSPPRSGSTLLRVMLGGHSRLFAPPELELLGFNTLAERARAFTGRDQFWLEGLVRGVMELKSCDAETAAELIAQYERDGLTTQEFYREMQRWAGGRVLVDKTPSYALDMSVLRRAEEDFDGAIYLHLIRHPAAMIRSFEEARLDAVFFRYPHSYGLRELAEMVWTVSHQNILAFLSDVDPARHCPVVFEELVREPEAVLRRMCRTIGIEYEPAMAEPYADKRRRMTDGLHRESRMLGDVKFHTHKGINASVAERWRDGAAQIQLAEETWTMATHLGYDRPAAPETAPQPHTTTQRIPAVSRGGAPLLASYAQRRLWFLDQLEQASATYNMPATVRVEGELDLDALTQALGELTRRHEVLRTTFAMADEEVVQVVHPPRPFALPLIDLSARPAAEAAAEAARLSKAEAEQPFDLAQGPLLRVTLLRLSADEHVLLVTMHHIISDGWSLGVLVREVASLYAAFAQEQASPLPELSIQYADYAAWQREWLQADVLERELSYWRTQLADVPVLELPTDYPRPPVQTFKGAGLTLSLSLELNEQLQALSRREGVTLFMTLLAAFKVLLYRYTGQSDIAVGTPIAGRNRQELEGLIGFFVNTLVLRTQLDAAESFSALLRRVREVTTGAYAHQDVPFEAVVEALQPERSLTHTPLFQVMLVEQRQTPPPLTMPGLQVQLAENESATAKFDLTLGIREAETALELTLSYNTDLFAAETMARLAGHYERLLQSIVADPQQRVATLPLLPAAEREQLLVAWNDTQRPYPPSQPIHELFAQQAARTPDAVALICHDERLTYADLNRRANQLAHQLQRLGVGPEARVAVALPRRTELLVALLAILKAGGAYVPLDPAYPRERLAFMLTDAGARLLLTAPELLPALPFSTTPMICLDRDGAALAQERADNPPSATAAQNLAYVIYTSGSTGRPKGVAITHHSAATFLHWAHEVFAPAELSGVLAATSVCFDLSVFELFAPLTCGGAVILAENALSLPELAAAGAVTLVNTVPSALTEVLRLGGLPQGVRTVNLAGEPLPRQLVEAAYATGTVERVLNLYGPTEDTTYSTWTVVPSDDGRVLIGRPVANTQAYVLDAERQPVPVGVAGELYLAGDGLARGYLNRPELTAERFIPNPFDTAGGGRLYRTGDLVRYTATGELDYLGRGDQQVKVRGYRIELGEIEAALARQSQVREAVVQVREDGGDKRLVAYMVGEQPVLDVSALRAALKEQLPEYMLPAAFVTLDALPLTPNGKIDRKALPAPEATSAGASAGYVEPRTAVEELLSQLWAGVLGVARVGIHDNFFELGGHSLLATQLVARVRTSFQVELPLRSLFESPTVAGFATEVERALRSGGARRLPPLAPVERDRPLPLSFAQQRLWFLDQLTPDSAAYNISAAVRLNGRLEVAALAGALREVVRRHEALRTTFPTVDDQPVQVVAAPGEFPLAVVELDHLPAAEREQEVARLFNEEARRPFDLAQGPLLRAGLLRLSATEHVLLLTMHHIISDGWSLGVLVKEVAALYAAYTQGQASPLPELTIQYADYAVWQRQWLRDEVLERELSYWRGQLADVPVLELPTDHPRPAVQSFKGARLAVNLPPELSEQLQALSQRAGVTLFMTLLAAFKVLLWRYTGQSDIAVGTPIAGRTQLEVEPLIGFFVNTLVLRTRVEAAESFRALLRRVREVTLAAYAHQDVPFEKLVEELAPERSLTHTPLFQVMMVEQRGPLGAVSMPGLEVQLNANENALAKFDLTLGVHGDEAGLGLSLSLSYNTDLFAGETMARMAGHYTQLLQSVVLEPQQQLARLPLLPAAEQAQLLGAWNETEKDYPAPLVHELFAQQAALTPDAPAVMFEEDSLTYRELNGRANQLARYLRRLGVGPEVRVALLLERSAEAVVALLGVLKAGGAYVALELLSPPERLALMLADAGAAVLLAERRSGLDMPAHAAQTVYLDDVRAEIAAESADDLSDAARAENLAYVIYTSGSTGTPKGVAVEHRQLRNYLHAVRERLELPPAASYATVSTLAADLGHTMIFPALCAGGLLHIVSQERAMDATALARYFSRHQIDCLKIVPSHLEALLAMQHTAQLLPRQRLIVGGESSRREWLAALASLAPDCTIFNHYGPTETTVGVLTHRFAPAAPDSVSGPVPLGRPVANTQVYVLDAGLQPVPVGVPGELYVGGANVTRGYLNRPAQTAEKFIPDLFARTPGARLYRTGDLARYRPDGQIEFLGRADNQLKLRGYRIELGEIEARLGEHANVREVVVAAREDEVGDKRLVAYVVPHSAPEPTHEELRKHLRAHVPEYMLPAAFVTLAALPLTPNGKVDRKALPAPEQHRAGARERVAPRTPVETQLAGLWSDVLHVADIGVHDNFFELGGHSLMATQLIARVRHSFRVELPLRTLFEQPTIAGLADVLEQSPVKEGNGHGPKIKSIPRGQKNLAALLAEVERLSDAQARSVLGEQALVAEELNNE